MSAAERFNPQAKLARNPAFAKFIAGEKIPPINVEVSVSHVCQRTCQWCFYAGTHEKMGPNSIMETEVAMKLLFEMRLMGCKAVTWTGGGEPTLHPDFHALVNFAALQGLSQGLFTNGFRRPKYDAAKLDWIRVSNTDKDWPVENMKLIREKAKAMGMAVNYVGDDAVVYRALDVGREVGVDYVQVRPALNLRGLVTDRQPPEVKDPLLHITEYKFQDCPNPHGYSNCYGFHFTPFVWHDGDVDVCGYHRKKGPPYTIGNLYRQGFTGIMENAPRHVPVCSTCQVACKNHEINKLINASSEVVDCNFV